MVDGGKDGSADADMSNEGSNWIISPPCSISLCCSWFTMGRRGVGASNIGWYEDCCCCAIRDVIGDHHD